MKTVILEDDYKSFLNFSMSQQAMMPQNPVQVNIIDKKFNEDFMKLGHKICDHERIEELSGFARRPSPYRFDEVIYNAENSTACGMKVNHFPYWRIHPWEQWEDGFIEFFIRMEGPTNGNEIFIWQNIRMKYLKKIIEQFAFKMEYWKF